MCLSFCFLVEGTEVGELDRAAEARSSCEKALALTQQEPEHRFLLERL